MLKRAPQFRAVHLRLFLLLLFQLTSFFLSPTASGQNYLYRHYTTLDGLCSHTVYGMMQDEEGYIWIGTDKGANRYDGKTFERYNRRNGMPDNEILHFFLDSQKRLWLYTFNGKLGYYKKGKIYTEKNSPSLIVPNGTSSTMSITEVSDKRICISQAGRGDLLTYTEREGVRSEPRNHWDKSMGDPVPISIYKAHGKIFHVYYDKILKVEENKSIPVVQYEPGKRISQGAINVSPENLLSYVINGEVVTFNGDQFNHHPIEGIPEGMLSSIIQFYRFEDDYWFILAKGGCLHYRFQQGKLKYMQMHLENVFLQTLYKDKEGNIWFGSKHDGMYMLPYFYSYIKSIEDVKEKCFSLCADKYKNVWMGMSKGTIKVMMQGGKPLSYQFPSAAHEIVRTIQQDCYGTMWVTTNSHIFKVTLSGERFHAEPVYVNAIKGKSYLFNIKDPHINSDSTFSINLGSGLNECSVENKELKGVISANLKERIYFAFKDSQKRYWISRESGVSVLEGNKEHKISDGLIIPHERISAIIELNANRLVVGTYGAGLYILDHGKVLAKMNKENGLSGDICKQLIVFNDTIYALMDEGITELVYRNGKFVILNRYSALNGLLPSPLNDIMVFDKTIHIASDIGLIQLERSRSIVSNLPPSIYITSVNLGGRVFEALDSEINVSALPLRFEYKAISFLFNEDLKFRYRLQPQAEWVSTSNRFIEFSSLEGGDYQFEVCVQKENGRWSASDTFTFHIYKPIWKQIWFIILCISLIIIGIMAYWLWSVRKSRKKYAETLALNTRIGMLENQALQTLMHPHFVFNALNSIQHLLNHRDATSANLHLSRFAKLIRLNLDSGMRGFITVEEEIERLKLYLNIESLRFEDKLFYSIKASEDLDLENIYIPSMIVQPFVENALWHGILPTNESGTVSINFSVKMPGVLNIYITDNGIGVQNNMALKKSSLHMSKGIHLIKNRMYILTEKYNKPFLLEQRMVEPENVHRPGTLVIITIPLLTEEDIF
jgi:ligand-binding sensor domain-containing protein